MVSFAVSTQPKSVVPSRTTAIAECKFVRAATQCTQLFGGACSVERFAETFAAARQGLVCAKHQPARQQSCNRSGLGAREVSRNRSRIRDAGFGFLGALVDLRWPYLDAKAGRGKNLATDLASRCEHKGLGI